MSDKPRPDDQGNLPIKIFAQQNMVIIDFSKSIAWVALDKPTALAMANAIINTIEFMQVEKGNSNVH